MNYFDERIASIYDADAADLFAPEVLDPAVSFLADLAGDGRALEFGVGTGRVALPLSQRGVPVSGIDLSPDMVAQLQAKAGASAVDVTIGDMSTTRVEGSFQIVYVVFNTIVNLLTQEEQVECFCNAAAHLEPGGCFVVEVGVPNLRRVSPSNRVEAFTVSPTRLGFDEYVDFVGQVAFSHHYWATADRLDVFSVPWRYAWPSELDLMARVAGMTLRERWSDWGRSAFNEESTKHISVWELPT
jgi:SAM-dependent methyltransferase